MDTPRRMPLQDLPLEPFTIPNMVTGSKTPRKHKRPLSPSRTTPLNPAKRRVLDVEGIPPSNNVSISPRSPVPFMLSNMRAVTPRPSRLGNGLVQNHGRSQGTLSPLSSHQVSPSRESYLKPTIESSTDPQSRHYPGFNIFRDNEHRRGSPTPRVSLLSGSNGDGLANRSEEDKENIPLKRRAKKFSSKKRPSTGAVGLDASCFVTPTQPCKVAVHPGRTPSSTRQALR